MTAITTALPAIELTLHRDSATYLRLDNGRVYRFRRNANFRDQLGLQCSACHIDDEYSWYEYVTSLNDGLAAICDHEREEHIAR